MKTARFKIADSYLNLIHEFPLRPIRNQGEYDAAISVVKKLMLRNEDSLDSGENDYLDALVEFTLAYEQKHHRFNFKKHTPLDRLKYLLEQSETTPAGLQKVLGCSQSLISLILSGKRELSKANIKALAAHFKFEPGYLM
jgi:HTH-type transcriptional regulator/antitoxin HigA